MGAILIESEAIAKAIEYLDESNFYKDAHKKIFAAMMALYERNDPIDVLTLAEELNKRQQLEEVGGNYYLTELVERVPSAANVEYHAKIVLEKSLLRKLITLSTEIADEAYSATTDAIELIDIAEQKIFGLSKRRLKSDFAHIKPILHETMEIFESFHGRESGITGISTGFDKLDELTSGLQRSDLVIVAGRPSMGKTAFCLDIARHAAVKERVGVGIFSLEMASFQLAMRMMCSHGRVDSHKVRTGRLPAEDWQRLSISVGELADAPIYVDDTPALAIMEIRAKARRLKAEHNIGLLIIDYLQLVRGPKTENRQQEISMISQSLKALAKELNIPVISLSQLSRAVESRGGERKPMLSDLRESGAIEQDADVVLFIYRPEVYGQVEDQGIAEIIIGKQRNGPIGTVKLAFLKEYVQFANLATFEEESFLPEPF